MESINQPFLKTDWAVIWWLSKLLVSVAVIIIFFLLNFYWIDRNIKLIPQKTTTVAKIPIHNAHNIIMNDVNQT